MNAGDEAHCASAATAAAVAEVVFGQTTCGSPWSGVTLDSYSRFVGIDEEVESAVGVLHLREEVRFPFRFLHDVADAVAALGDAEIVQRGDARQRIHREHEVVDQAGAVGRVFAVIARVMMAAGDVDRARVHEREQRVCLAVSCGAVWPDYRIAGRQ